MIQIVSKEEFFSVEESMGASGHRMLVGPIEAGNTVLDQLSTPTSKLMLDGGTVVMVAYVSFPEPERYKSDVAMHERVGGTFWAYIK